VYSVGSFEGTVHGGGVDDDDDDDDDVFLSQFVCQHPLSLRYCFLPAWF
jgi:hypothetical protein